MTRLAVFKTETEESLDVLRWLDRKLIRLVSRFAGKQSTQERKKEPGERKNEGAELALFFRQLDVLVIA